MAYSAKTILLYYVLHTHLNILPSSLCATKNYNNNMYVYKHVDEEMRAAYMDERPVNCRRYFVIVIVIFETR